MHWLKHEALRALEAAGDAAARATVYADMNRRLQQDSPSGDDVDHPAGSQGDRGGSSSGSAPAADSVAAVQAALVPFAPHLRRDLASPNPQLCVGCPPPPAACADSACLYLCLCVCLCVCVCMCVCVCVYVCTAC
jgi:hypothetical protein